MRLVQDYLPAHFQSPLTGQLLSLGNYERQIELCGEGRQSWDKHTDTNMFILRRPYLVSFIINIAFLVIFIECSFASLLILLSFVKPVLYILCLCQHEARFTGYGLCQASRVYSLSRRRDQS